MKTTLEIFTGLFLTLCLAVPMGFSAFAGEVTLTETIIEEGVTIDLNTGVIEINNGTVIENAGPTQEDADGGNIGTNNGTVVSNYGTVDVNNGSIGVYDGDSLSGGNDGIVKENAEDGTIIDNCGIVETNNGTVEDNNGTVDVNQGTINLNYGTVDTNNGIVEYNFSAVQTNTKDGVIYYNRSVVEENYGIVDNYAEVNNNLGIINNYSRVYNNYGEVYNYDGGGIVKSFAGAVYFTVNVQTENADITGWEGFRTHNDQNNWLASNGQAAITITPQEGYEIDALNLPRGVSGERKEDGSWVLTVRASYNAISLNITATVLQAPGSDMLPPSVESDPCIPEADMDSAPVVPESDISTADWTWCAPEQSWPVPEPVNVSFTIDLAEDAFHQFNLDVIDQIRNASENDTVRVDAEEWEGFEIGVFDALAERPDVVLEITCKIDEEPVELIIPAGFVLPEDVHDEIVTFRQIREWMEE